MRECMSSGNSTATTNLELQGHIYDVDPPTVFPAESRCQNMNVASDVILSQQQRRHAWVVLRHPSHKKLMSITKKNPGPDSSPDNCRWTFASLCRGTRSTFQHYDRTQTSNPGRWSSSSLNVRAAMMISRLAAQILKLKMK